MQKNLVEAQIMHCHGDDLGSHVDARVQKLGSMLCVYTGDEICQTLNVVRYGPPTKREASMRWNLEIDCRK